MIVTFGVADRYQATRVFPIITVACVEIYLGMIGDTLDIDIQWCIGGTILRIIITRLGARP